MMVDGDRVSTFNGDSTDGSTFDIYILIFE